MNRTVAIYGGVAVAAIAVVAYLLWRGKNSMANTPYEGFGLLGFLGHTANTVSGGKLQATGEKIGETVYNVFNPGSDVPDVHYAVTFPDGTRHAVYAGDIDKSGYFVWGGRRWRLLIDGDTKRAQAA